MVAGVVSFIAHSLTLDACSARIIAHLNPVFCLSTVSTDFLFKFRYLPTLTLRARADLI